MDETDRTDSEYLPTESDCSTPQKLIFESELWIECPKDKY